MVKINGEMLAKDGMNVADVLAEMNINPQNVAVELNEEIVPKASYGTTVLSDGDVLEVVRFVGGG
ncbi:sulfur carrier protein ThiS [uncultured Ruminococcus sp.]|uniref:sulfur carrier protein ThiS n=1 Tax=uncultured Ruminococcus sp. TaxID=165186 RepID=UPI00260859B9|nr:sulfur carrier protein ThiS [uncultured Ruminococcus sp.]